MDANRILHILASFSAGLLLFFCLRGRLWGFVLAALPVIITAALGLFFFRDTAGYITGALWAVLVLVPLFGQRRLARLLARQRYGEAARFAAVLRYVHPLDGWWDRPAFYRALDLSQHGRVDEATRLLEELIRSSGTFRREAQVHLLRMHGRWEDVLAWLDDPANSEGARRDPGLLPIHLRALGETGALERLVTLYAESEPRLDRAGAAGLNNLCRLFVFAFAGMADRVEALFHGPLAAYPQTLQTFWQKTAELTTAPEGPARAAIEALLAEPDGALRQSVRRRLEVPLADPREALSPVSMKILAGIERERDHEERYGQVTARFRPHATFGLMGAIVAMFTAQLFVARSLRPEESFVAWSQSVEALYDLGALWPVAVLEGGEWWRVFAATMLHFGSLHLFMNLGGLYVLGPYVEFAIGRVRYLIVYVFSGVGMMSLVVLFFHWGLMEEQLLMGASGAIMGLIGATGAVAWRGLRVEKSKVARRRLGWMVFYVGLQALFDGLTPHVSSISHFGGAVLGFAAASLMAHRVTSRAVRSS